MRLCSLGVPRFSGGRYKHTNIEYIVSQDLTKCSPKGRDCVERNSARSFNCNTTCEGIYAGVEWEEETMVFEEDNELGVENKAMTELYKGMYERMKKDLKKEMRLTKGQKGEKLDKEKYMRLVSEYKKFKKTACQHFRFNSAANLTRFGKFQFANPTLFLMKIQERSSQSRRFSWCRSTLTRPPSTRWRGTRRSRRRPS